MNAFGETFDYRQHTKILVMATLITFVGSNSLVIYTYYAHDKSEFGSMALSSQIMSYIANDLFFNAELLISILFLYLCVITKIRFRAVNSMLR